MKLQTSAGAAMGGLCLLIAIASSGAGSASPRPPGLGPLERGRGPDPERRLLPQLHRAANTPSPCKTNFPGGYSFNGIAGAAETAGGDDSAVLGGYGNQACDADDGIGSGYLNDIDTEGTGLATYSFIGGGQGNLIISPDAFIGGGTNNAVDGGGAAIAGGDANVAYGENSVVGGGTSNNAIGSFTIVGAGSNNDASGTNSFVGAGDGNVSISTALDSVISGGDGNMMSGQKATIGGGEQNNVSGSFATIPGGYRDEALGNESFAAGSQAEARYTGSFVWSDYVSSEKPQSDSAAGEFVARASGGVYFFSNAASSAGVHLAAGSGTWSSLSDRSVKTGIVPLDDEAILAKVAALPISVWQYKTERGVNHVGPMAQDFYAAFGVGEDDRHITSIDEDGIALAAIKALRDENRKLEREIAALRDERRAGH